MKNKVLKVLLATMLMVSMLGTTCMAAGGEMTDTVGSTITGDSKLKSPIYKVVVPTGLDFAIDAFEQGGQSQIYSKDFCIINKSNVPVRVNVAVKATPKEDVTLKAAETDVTETNADKLLYMAVEVPSEVTETAAAVAAYKGTDGTPLTFYKDSNVDSGAKYYTTQTSAATESEVTAEMVDTTAVEGTYDKSAKSAISSTDKDFVFVLGKATYVDYYENSDDTEKTDSAYKANAADEAGSTVFRFYGKANSKAAWAEADVTASATYTFLGLSATNYTALKAKEVEIETGVNAHGYVVEDEKAAFTSTQESLGVITYTEGVGAYALNKIISATAQYQGEATDFLAGLTVDATNKKITMPEGYITAFADENEGTVEFTIVYDAVGGGDDATDNAPADDVTVTVNVYVE